MQSQKLKLNKTLNLKTQNTNRTQNNSKFGNFSDASNLEFEVVGVGCQPLDKQINSEAGV